MTALEDITHPKVQLPRPPANPEELWWVVRTLWGVTIPRTAVCGDHVAPFTAFAEGYFGNDSNIVLWYGSRGTGKSLLLALLALTKAAILEINVTLLGGSMAQSNNVQEHIESLLTYPGAPSWAVAQQIQTQITFSGGNWIRPLPASQKTVRGPHPQMTCLDEIDEMDRKVYDAAMGQAMSRPNARGIIIPEMVVASSTWQNPVGCIAYGTATTTRRGVVPIQDVLVGDEVPTRHGWRKVTGSHDTGMQETLTVTFASGRRVTATPWHKFWTDSHGWIRADALTPGLHVGTSLVGLTPALASGAPAHGAAHTPSVEIPIVGIGDAVLAQVVPVLAEDSDFLMDERPEVVLADVDGLQVPRVDAVAPTAQVVDVKPVGNRSVELHPDPAVSRDDALGERAVGLDAVAVLHDAEGPADAVVGVEVDGVPFAEDEVVDVSHVPIVLPTWDLTVDGTHEYVANGILVHNTFQEVRDEFLAKGLPVRTWCWREVLRTEGNPDGWMDPEFVERKRKAVPAEMFRVEYDLGEPAGGSRAFDLERLNAAFVPMVPVSERHAGSDDEWVFEAPVSTGWYAVGADWAKESDRTVIVVARIDESVRRVVYVRCVNRRPWPEMAGMFNDVLRRYANVVAAHDGTGIGNVVNDLIDERALKFIMSGRKRSDMLVDYISAVEQGRYRLPVGCTLLSAHKATTVEDVYAPGKWNGHLPDEVAACALAHYAAEHGAPVAAMVGVERSEYRPRATKELYPEGSVTVVGDVRNVTGVDDGGWNFLV